MATRPKVHGYNDSASLAESVRCNQQLTLILQRMLRQHVPLPSTTAVLLTEAGLLLARQRNALSTMEEIRREAKYP